MLSSAKIGRSSWRYYQDTVVAGACEYYSERGDAEGRWHGHGLAELGLSANDIDVISKHDTSTAANDPNESQLHEWLADALGRDSGNPLYVISQKSLTGHAKGGAAAFQMIGLCQVLAGGILPPNRNLDCVDDALSKYQRLVWLRQSLETGPLKAGLVTSLDLVELNPFLDDRGMTARLMVDLVGSLMGKKVFDRPTRSK